MKNNIVHKLNSNNEQDILSALEALYDEYYNLVYFCIIGIVENTQDSEDLANEVFVKVYNNREKLNKDKNLKYYIITIARNLAIDFIRKRKLHIEYNDNYIFDYVDTSNDNNYTFNELIDAIKPFLSKEEIDIIIYHFLYNESFDAISRKLGKPVSTIRTIYYRSLKKVKK